MKDYDILPKETCEALADHFETFIDNIQNLVIIEDIDKEEMKKATKVLNKAIKNLRKGKVEKVFDMDRLLEYMEEHGGLV